ncbi:ATP-binding protein [Sphingobacterium phlebotomi]|uniref:ATP-binding protein n=1 Tax=Sphingobacterium phlebotomi TaxID=2605433 RepID=A0A5D4H9P9_9SPHI|nr:ATP-binding protein [Sphingobacterium phlebotomi]TYR36185.1 ATP-binding protein [Sphingobacterium phlebotomi]
MRRDLYEKLLEWKGRKSHKPLIIRGARQVGKTWLMKHFGKTEYKNVAYVNMESNAIIRDLFKLDFNIDRILLGLQIETGMPIDTDTLIIFDEIQESPEAITSLKYFYENAPQYDIICAGSLLGVALTRHTSFPVGKVEFLDLYPLRFSEFAAALGEHALLTLLENPDWTLIAGFSSRYVELLRQYYYVGGMPEAVTAFAKNKNFQQVREIQKRILAAYEQDFSKHAPSSIVPRIRMLWNSIPAQLAKENKKFIYGIIRQGARAKDYELAIAWLIDCGLVHRVHNVTKPGIPLKAYEDFNSFKIFLVDVGLLGAMTDLDVRTLLEGQALFQEFKGALTEQYVLQELTARGDMSIYYWSLENSRAEIDFLIQKNGKIIPIEVKAEENLQAKSLRVYYDKYKPDTAIRTSMSNYREEDWMTNIPLYALTTAPNLFE